MGFSVKLILGSRVSHFLLVYTKGKEYSKVAGDDDEQLDKEAPHNDIYNSNVFPQEGTSRLLYFGLHSTI